MSEPVASQEAEARDVVVNAGRSFGGPNRGPGGRDSLAAINGALDAYAATIRASERERLATAIKGIRHNAKWTGGTAAFQVWVIQRCDELLAALEEAESA